MRTVFGTLAAVLLAAAAPRASAMPPVATTGRRTASTTAGTSARVPTIPRSACAASKQPRWPPASAPCATTASAPAASAASASATVETLAHHAMPRAFSSATTAGG